MNLQITSWELQRMTPCAEVAWADLRPPFDGKPQSESLDGLVVSSTDDDIDVMRALLRSAPKIGLAFSAQCRVGHRPESPSRVRLHKGLFGERGRRTGGKTVELAVSATQVTLIGAWLLDDLAVKVAPEGCLDHSTCCFVVSSEPIQLPELLDSLRGSVITKGTCSINYPDLADAICPLGHFIMKAHPRYRQRVVVLGRRGSMTRLGGWVAASAANGTPTVPAAAE
jgi:hypothetical protein